MRDGRVMTWWRDSVLVGQTVEAWLAQLVREERARLAWQVRLWLACAQADQADDHTDHAPASRSVRGAPSSDIWLTISEAARAVGCQRVTLHQAVRESVIQTRRDPGSIKKKVRLADVEQWQQTRPRLVGRAPRQHNDARDEHDKGIH